MKHFVHKNFYIAKVEVASSNLVSRSKEIKGLAK